MDMKREILDAFKEWKEAPGRKPLVLKGTRQVGKTWALQEFGKEYYESKGHKCHYIDLREANDLHSIFTDTLDPHQIIKLLQFRLKKQIDTKHDLLILDEIQECSHAITSLKYFYQHLNELDIIVAGSHMGLMKNEESFPVGKVNFLYMFPMNFSEFVAVLEPSAHEYLDRFNFEEALPTVVHERLLELLTLYLFTGGLPEVVCSLLQKWPDNIDTMITDVRKIQNELIQGYRADFAKYSGVVNANHINYLFDAFPSQLSKTQDANVKRFKFKQVIPNRKGFDSIRGPLMWLLEARLCIQNRIAKKSLHPLRSYCEENRFKVFLFDVGLLNCLLNIPGEAMLGETIGTFKGFILENFVAQELFASTNEELTSWQEGSAELEFLLSVGIDIVPIEVKSASRSRRAKSLEVYIKKYNPKRAFKLTRQNLIIDQKRGIITAPVYCSYKITTQK